MHTVRYEAPGTIAGALDIMASAPGAMVLAGGTDLLVQYQSGLKRPAVFLDVKRIPEMMAIVVDADGATIGAAAPAAVICADRTLQAWYPGLVEGVHLIGSTQIQGRGSIGGNLCNGSPAADSVCALIADRAVARIAGPTGTREVPVEAFMRGPGRTALAPGELLVAVRLPKPAPHTADAYQRLIPRSEMDIAVASCGVSLTFDATGTCTAARVAIGAVAPTPLLVLDAAAALVGTTVDPEALDRAAAAASAAAHPIDDRRGTAAYRRTVVGVLTKRVAALAAARAKER
ncbi:MAG: xanthine dehydrogenase family protein subunit M [Acidobacteria bacterium]|nr:xanthine dehydrogenase family protein subunit M [Acidobacteriota bacterium]